jgi:hypothetical protein
MNIKTSGTVEGVVLPILAFFCDLIRVRADDDCWAQEFFVIRSLTIVTVLRGKRDDGCYVKVECCSPT